MKNSTKKKKNSVDLVYNLMKFVKDDPLLMRSLWIIIIYKNKNIKIENGPRVPLKFSEVTIFVYVRLSYIIGVTIFQKKIK